MRNDSSLSSIISAKQCNVINYSNTPYTIVQENYLAPFNVPLTFDMSDAFIAVPLPRTSYNNIIQTSLVHC